MRLACTVARKWAASCRPSRTGECNGQVHQLLARLVGQEFGGKLEAQDDWQQANRLVKARIAHWLDCRDELRFGLVLDQLATSLRSLARVASLNSLITSSSACSLPSPSKAPPPSRATCVKTFPMVSMAALTVTGCP